MTYPSESETSEAAESVLSQLPSYSTEIGNNVKKPHFCDFRGCSAKFSRPWRLAAHKAVHFGQKPFPCDYEGCDKAYTYSFHLRRHKSIAHKKATSQQLYKCHYPGCNKEFSFIQNERKHFRRTHEEKKCKICGEQFFKHLQLKKHLKIHQKGYVFECSHCGVKFKHQFLYRRHLSKHKIYVCSAKGCSESYQNWSSLRKHLSTHPYDFVCAYCKKGYRVKKHLKTHIIRHLEGFKRKPHQLKKIECSICKASILGKASLRRHIRVMHEKSSEKRPPEQKKIRAPRKDKGIPKRSLAVVLSEVIVPQEIERQLILTDTSTDFIDINMLSF